MPIYEYECEACHYRFEALVPIAHRDEVVCEKCGEAHVTRLASTFAATGQTIAGSYAGGACCSGGCSCCGD
jgi:putative FmdB family regulatory protein